MPAEPAFLNDKLESLVRRCIVFPADGSPTRTAHMIARTVTVEDTTALKLHSRCVDMASTFGEHTRKTRVMPFRSAGNRSYLFFYNLSPNLPINLKIAGLTGITHSDLKAKKRLFWRGDVVAMMVQPESEMADFIVESLDADLSELRPLEEVFRKLYREGYLEGVLRGDESQWEGYTKFFLSNFNGATSLFGAPTSYWGSNAAEQEKHYLNDLNELRCIVGRPPIPPPVYKKSYTEQVIDLLTTFKSAFSLQQTEAVANPKLPPDLERRIFEMCAFENPQLCPVLVHVAKRVNEWIDPISVETVLFMEDFRSKGSNKLELFLAKLTGRKPVEYYARHVKNLAIIGFFRDKVAVINRILSICTGVKNLLLLTPDVGFDFFDNPRAGRNLRRLALRLENFFQKERDPSSWKRPNFDHPCFANLTHLHLSDYDGRDDWAVFNIFTGWENLTHLTHLAFAYAGDAEETMPLIQRLPMTVRYIAVGPYNGDEEHRYSTIEINNFPGFRAAWGDRVVFVGKISAYDWERGARGEGDFWDIVEQEIERRFAENSRLESVQ